MFREKKAMLCDWPADIFLETIRSLRDCEDVLALCSTSTKCAKRCGEALRIEGEERPRILSWSCLLRKISDHVEHGDHREVFFPGWRWEYKQGEAWTTFLNDRGIDKRLLQGLATFTFDRSRSIGYVNIQSNTEPPRGYGLNL